MNKLFRYLFGQKSVENNKEPYTSIAITQDKDRTKVYLNGYILKMGTGTLEFWYQSQELSNIAEQNKRKIK